MAVNYFQESKNATSSALIVTIVLVLTSNLTLIYNMLDALHNAQSRAEGLTDILARGKVKPIMPPSATGEEGIHTKNARVTFSITHDGSTQEKVVAIPEMAIEQRGLICFKAQTGSGKSTLFRILTGCFDDYDGSVRFNGHEVGLFMGIRIAQVKQELKKVDVPIIQLFGLHKEEATSSDWELCRQILAWVGFSDAWLAQNVSTLSGGERRRILTAFGLYRAVKLRLEAILLDEPTNGLDVEHVKMLCEGLKAFAHTYRIYVGVASHDTMLQETADQVISW